MNHSGHFPRIFVSLTVAMLLMLGQRGGGTPAEATIIYTFTTTAPAPLAGPVSGAFSVPDSAILDGFIRAPEIISYHFVLPSAVAPFAPATFSAPDPLTILSPFAGAMSVDPNTGTFTADSLILITDVATSQQLDIIARSLFTPRYEIGLGEPPFQQFVQGDGLWTVQRVPEPSSILLLASALIFILLCGVRPAALFAHRRGSTARQAVGLLLVVGTVGWAAPAWAWGDLGHKIVCQIAFQELNDKARAEVLRLIALDEKFDSFTDACTWPDHPRKRAEEHFINVPRTLQTIGTANCQGVPTCLFTAIVTDREVLKTSNDDQAKLASLKFLGHWVGDIHQPLHVSFADDRGGNFIRESGPCVNSLHTVWDTCIIEKKLGTDPMTVARDLLDGLPESDKTAWVAIPVEGWANESFQVTRRKSVGYCVRVGSKCVYQQGNETFTQGEEEKVVVVNIAYLEQHVPFVRDRLKRAGIRLAHLLNTTVGQ